MARKPKYESSHLSDEEFADWIDDTLAPDYWDSGREATAEDLYKCVDLIRYEDKDEEYAEWLRETLISDLHDSGDHSLANDFTRCADIIGGSGKAGRKSPRRNPVRGRSAARRAANRLWDSLSESQRWQLGDDLVLGAYESSDWFDEAPPPGTLRELDNLRMLWEETRSPYRNPIKYSTDDYSHDADKIRQEYIDAKLAQLEKSRRGPPGSALPQLERADKARMKYYNLTGRNLEDEFAWEGHPGKYDKVKLRAAQKKQRFMLGYAAVRELRELAQKHGASEGELVSIDRLDDFRATKIDVRRLLPLAKLGSKSLYEETNRLLREPKRNPIRGKKSGAALRKRGKSACG